MREGGWERGRRGGREREETRSLDNRRCPHLASWEKRGREQVETTEREGEEGEGRERWLVTCGSREHLSYPFYTPTTFFSLSLSSSLSPSLHCPFPWSSGPSLRVAPDTKNSKWDEKPKVGPLTFYLCGPGDRNAARRGAGGARRRGVCRVVGWRMARGCVWEARQGHGVEEWRDGGGQQGAERSHEEMKEGNSKKRSKEESGGWREAKGRGRRERDEVSNEFATERENARERKLAHGRGRQRREAREK